MIGSFLNWLTEAPIWLLGALMFAAAMMAGLGGRSVRKWSDRSLPGQPSEHTEGEGYIVSAVLGLLALLTGFTLSLTLERFEARRILVLEDANAIGSMYRHAQLLGEPHRTRLSSLLVQYTDNRIALARADRDSEGAKLLEKNNRLITEFSAATSAAFDSVVNLDFSSTLVEAARRVNELDATRKAARLAHVPTVVFALLVVYLVGTAGLLGYVILLPRNLSVGAFALALLILSLLLIIDLDRPTKGSVQESQGPMERLLETLKSQPPQAFDRWRKPAQ